MDKLISLEAAIETFKNCAENGMSIDGIVDALEQLPPVLPEIIRCKDCNHFYKDNLNQWCFLGKYGVKENGFCSRAERRTDGINQKTASD